MDKAAAAGVKVIAYDRLIKTDKISAYLSFDNVEVGRNRSRWRHDSPWAVRASTTWTKDNPVKVVLSGGSPTDNNAVLVRKGQMEVLQPYIDKGVVKIVADQWVDNWDAAKAEAMMENILTAQQNKIDAVVASNDGTALGELQAMKAQGLAGKVPISGQDATADGCNSIVKGAADRDRLQGYPPAGPTGSGYDRCADQGPGSLTGLKKFTLADTDQR